MEGGKPEYPEKNPRSKDENQQQTQPTYDTGTGNRTRATLVDLWFAKKKTDEGLTLETSAFNLFTGANLPHQLSW